jgi:hypothetical protein
MAAPGVLCEGPAMRSTLLFLVGFGTAALVAACGDGHDHYGYRSNGSSIVFGISETKDAATGKTVTKAGHEYLSLANRGGSKVTMAEVSTDDVCIHEELDHRIGRPNVGDGGRARFSGAAIPGDGLVIEANGPNEPILEGNAFRGDDPLTFGVDFGFALPEFGSVRLPAPNAHLKIDQPADAGELSLDVTKDGTVAWSPDLIDENVSPATRRERFMVSYETDDEQEHGNNVRCFYDEKDGTGVIPAKWLALIGPKGTKGTITYASHRQVEVFARGNWLIYVVGTIVLREQRFVVQ